MRRTRNNCTALALALLSASPAFAGDYELTSFAVAGGGGTMTGDNWTLVGTIGQHDAGGPMTGRENDLSGGFWVGPPAPSPCAADITGPTPFVSDGNVDALDFLLLISQWSSPCVGSCEADITGTTPLVSDGNVDALDFLLLISQWGNPGVCSG